MGNFIVSARKYRPTTFDTVVGQKSITETLQQYYYFHVWNHDLNEVRLMCSWDTTEEDVRGFVAVLKKLVGVSS